MALPSQASAPIRSRSHMYRRRKSKRQPVFTVLLVIAISSLLVWWALPTREGSPAPQSAQNLGEVPAGVEDNDPGQMRSEQNSVGIIDPTASATTPPAISQPQPEASIEMGGGGASESTGTPAPRPQGHAPRPQANPARPPETFGAGDTGSISARLRQKLQRGQNMLAENRLVDARKEFSGALASGILTPAEADQVRQILTDLNEELVFRPSVADGDQFARSYVIQGGDLLSTIVARLGLLVDWRFIQRINNIASPNRIRAGQRLKLVTGPFHAVVHKNDYRLDLYLGEGEDRVFVRSFSVGLGEHNATPTGMFRVKLNSKLINPQWTDPRSGRVFSADNPANPIGERWLGLEGLDPQTRDLQGYGIHGTIDPKSIGKQASMGCVRMRHEDVEIIYEVLIESLSTVEIRAD